MNGRNRRGNRRPGMKARLGIATAVLVGGGAVGVAAVAANTHGSATTTADSAGYMLHFHHGISEQQALSSALSTWGWSQQRSLSTLAQMAPMRTFSQFWWHRTQFAAQRGVVVAATRQFLVVRSANGNLEVWWLTGATKFRNVSANGTGMVAMTGNNVAAHTMMTTGNTAPVAATMAGSAAVVNQMAAPVVKPVTVTVNTGTEVINITITPAATATGVPAATATATVMPAATATATTMATATPMPITTVPATTMTQGVARGDLVFVIGERYHRSLVAKLVLFAPKTVTNTVTPAPTTTNSAATPNGAGTAPAFGHHS